MSVAILSRGEFETRATGRRLANLLHPGDVLLLSGRLGSGKTAFVAGLAEGLGVEEWVISPSFMLVRRYKGGFIPLVHADVYRVGSLNEVEDLDLFEEARAGVLAVEWGNAVAGAMPNDHLRIEFEVTGPETRTIRFVPQGEWTNRPLTELVE